MRGERERERELYLIKDCETLIIDSFVEVLKVFPLRGGEVRRGKQLVNW